MSRPDTPGTGFGPRGLAACVVVSLLLHAGGGAAVFLLGNGARADAEHPEFFPLTRHMHPYLGSPTVRVESLSWIGAPVETGASGLPSTVDQARQELPSPSAFAEAGGRAVGVAHDARREVVTVAEQAAWAARRKVTNALGTLFPAGADVPRGDRDRTRTETADTTEAAQQEDRGDLGNADRTTSEANTPTQRGDTGDEGREDRQAPASRRVTIDDADLGERIEAFGLRILTRRPTFSLVTEVRARVRNPRVLVDFGARGDVTRVEFLSRSGHADVDADLENALWAWRAVPTDPRPQRGSDDGISLPASIEFEITLRPTR